MKNRDLIQICRLAAGIAIIVGAFVSHRNDQSQANAGNLTSGMGLAMVAPAR